MKAIDLIEECQERRQEFIKKIRKYESFTEEHPKFKIGDKISFYSGYHDNILYHSEIIGFNTDNEIYILWDCYWFPIRDKKITRIRKITK